MIHDTTGGPAANNSTKSLGIEDFTTIELLKKHQGKQSDEAFCKRWLGISASGWNRLKSGTYQAKDWSRMMDKLRTGLHSLENAQENRSLRGDTGNILPLSHIREALAAVKRAQGLPRNRMVLVLAPTGGGKSTIARGLVNAFGTGCVFAEATESWRSNYLAACNGLGKAIGLSPSGRLLNAEDVLFRALQSEGVVVIDEGHHLGPRSINVVKAILNNTPRVVVLLAIKPLLSRMRQTAWVEAEQLLNRTSEVIDLTTIGGKDFGEFLKARVPGFSDLGTTANEWTNRAMKEANRFGLWNTAEIIATRAREETAEAGLPAVTLEILETALDECKRLRAAL